MPGDENRNITLSFLPTYASASFSSLTAVSNITTMFNDTLSRQFQPVAHSLRRNPQQG